MILLNKGTLTRSGVIWPESVGLELEERNSQAVLTLGPEAPEVALGDWMTDPADPGAGIVWRVAGIETTYETNTRRVTLEHVISELKDTILFGETDLTGTATAALTAVLARSAHWRLGSCAYNVTLPYTFDGETLWEAVESICETLEDSCWEYDLTSVPFQLHVRRLGSAVGSEMRCGRNIRTLRKTIDKSDMYTRFYPIGKEELKLSGTQYVSRNEDRWGVISATETNQAISEESMLRAWAENRVRRHSEPTVTVAVAGLELSAATGESLDHFAVGVMCRVPIPEIGETILERITKLSWADKLKDPESVTVTMANRLEDAATVWKTETQKSRSGGRSASKKAEEDHAWFTDTTDHVSMTAEAIIGKSEDGTIDWSRIADITVSGSGIYSTVTETKNDMVTAKSAITQTSNSISQIVSAVGANGQVTAASIVTAVNRAGSSVQISADHILLSGNVNLNEVMAVNGGSVYMRRPLYVNWNGSVTSIQGGVISAQEVRVNHIMPLKVTNVTVDGNTLKISYADGTSANFSKATALSGGWSGNITAGKAYMVTAKQNGVTVGTHYSPALDGYYKGTTGYDTSGYSWVSTPVTVYDEEGEDLFRDTVQITIPSEVISYWQSQGGHTTPHTMYKGFNTSDSIYYGRLYDGNGNALTNNSYYWFGCTSNVGGSNASVVMYT